MRLSATVLVVRPTADATDGLEVLLLQRNHRGGFVAGATLFPGGATDAEDAFIPTIPTIPAAATIPTVADDDDGQDSVEGDWASVERLAAVAAARECFEEAGILLAVNADGAWATPTQIDGVAASSRFADGLISAGLHVPIPRFRPWGRWVTPIGASRRYDTVFFVVAAPHHHEIRVDGIEIVDAAWWDPSAALAAEAAGELRLVTPTRKTLERLAPHRTYSTLDV